MLTVGRINMSIQIYSHAVLSMMTLWHCVHSPGQQADVLGQLAAGVLRHKPAGHPQLGAHRLGEHTLRPRPGLHSHPGYKAEYFAESIGKNRVKLIDFFQFCQQPSSFYFTAKYSTLPVIPDLVVSHRVLAPHGGEAGGGGGGGGEPRGFYDDI